MKPGRWSLVTGFSFLFIGVMDWIRGEASLWFAIFCCFALAYRNFMDAVEEWA